MTDHRSSRSVIPDELVRQLETQGVPVGSYSFKPLDGMRKLIARRMTESVRIAPHFSAEMPVRIDALLGVRERLNEGQDVRVSINDYLIKASAVALTGCPEVNVSFTDAGIISHHHADIAFAVALPGGLVTPIVRQAETKSLQAIAAETQDLAARGRNKRLKPEEYFGGSFSISNLGMFGVSTFGAIINQPQSAILSVGGPEKTYVLDGDQPRWATTVRVTLTSDHRVIDGAAAARWLQVFKNAVENPETLT